MSSARSRFGLFNLTPPAPQVSIHRAHVVVGSYNLDPRSTILNCEQGVLLEDETIARELIEIFDAQTTAEHAWQVSVKDGKLSWTDGVETFDSDPKASFGRKFQAWFARTFHLDAQL